MLKMFRIEALNDSGRAVQTVAYRYGRREPHLAPDIRRMLAERDRMIVASMRARGLTVRASRVAL